MNTHSSSNGNRNLNAINKKKYSINEINKKCEWYLNKFIKRKVELEYLKKRSALKNGIYGI